MAAFLRELLLERHAWSDTSPLRGGIAANPAPRQTSGSGWPRPLG